MGVFQWAEPEYPDDDGDGASNHCCPRARPRRSLPQQSAKDWREQATNEEVIFQDLFSRRSRGLDRCTTARARTAPGGV